MLEQPLRPHALVAPQTEREDGGKPAGSLFETLGLATPAAQLLIGLQAPRPSAQGVASEGETAHLFCEVFEVTADDKETRQSPCRVLALPAAVEPVLERPAVHKRSVTGAWLTQALDSLEKGDLVFERADNVSLRHLGVIAILRHQEVSRCAGGAGRAWLTHLEVHDDAHVADYDA